VYGAEKLFLRERILKTLTFKTRMVFFIETSATTKYPCVSEMSPRFSYIR